jgi:S-adenosylmethionine:tRNA ribosyltransferase-isomerase
MLNKLERKRILTTYITLHTGPGTFLPVRDEDISKHRVHPEYYELRGSELSKLRRSREDGGKIVAVGTTVVRALESACRMGNGISYDDSSGRTDLFIFPPFEFLMVDVLLTNFHLPKSTLLMLVSAFAGRELILEAYREAVKENYRFYSYGDAMLIL